MPKAYENAGVSVEAGYEVVKRIKSHVARTNRPGVVGGIGGFGGLFDLGLLGLQGAGAHLRHRRRGHQAEGRLSWPTSTTPSASTAWPCASTTSSAPGRRAAVLPGLHRLRQERTRHCIEQVVAGVAEGCVQAGCALIGGETAEMPGMYDEDEYDLAGFSVGVAEKSAIVDGSTIAEGDVLIGLPSTGVHSNGFSLVRKALFEQAGYTVDTDTRRAGRRKARRRAARPTKIYVKAHLSPVQARAWSRASAHITGGGFIENIPRMIPDGLAARNRPRLLARAPDLRRAGEGWQHRS